MNYFNTLAFGIYPFIAAAVFFIGSWLRYDQAQFTWKAGSSQMLNRSGMRMASNLFHIGILIIFFGHLIGLLTPTWLYEPVMSAGTKQVLAIVIGGIAGVMCFIGAFALLLRRLTDPRVRATSSFAEVFIIALLLVQVALGLLTIWPTMDHLDGSEMVKFSAWAQGIFTFQVGAADYLLDVHWIYKLHIFIGITIFLLFPFTRLVHVWSVPVQYVSRRYQIVRQRG